jgi:hypothetical protein
VIRNVSRDFVPVALPLEKIRKAGGEAGRFFQAVQKQRPDQYQGIYIVSPEGKVLANQAREPGKGKSWAADLLERMDRGLEAFGPVRPRRPRPTDPLPYRGVGVQRDGSISAAVCTRYLFGGLERDKLGQVVLDTLTLSAKDGAQLVPDETDVGSRWVVPEAVARKFSRLLSPRDGIPDMPLPGEVTSVRLTGTVDAVRGGVAYLRYEGHIAGRHTFEYEDYRGKKNRARAYLTGVGSCEVKTGRLLSLTLVADGVYQHYPPYDEVMKYGAVVEWRRER